jgi:hypothetical protein
MESSADIINKKSEIVLIVDGGLVKSIIHNTLMDYKEDLITKDEGILRIFDCFLKYIEIKK